MLLFLRGSLTVFGIVTINSNKANDYRQNLLITTTPGAPKVMDGDATSTTSMDVVKVGLENQVGLELGVILG